MITIHGINYLKLKEAEDEHNRFSNQHWKQTTQDNLDVYNTIHTTTSPGCASS